ncbi:MAG: multicopper oxidase family protein [Actinobacteria bacterium]|nr:multicopper oxidase family protein [Actinomycetota bacterium]
MSATRRWWFLTAGAAAVVVAAAIALVGRPATVQAIAADAPEVAAFEAERRDASAPVREVTLTAVPATVRIGDTEVETWTFNQQLPGPEVRVAAGQVLRARVENRLPEPLTIHWHGVDLRADMDGVPDLTQPPIAPGEDFTYEFTVPDPGTFIYHSHVGMQLDRGLYGALIVDDPDEQAVVDRELTLVLDDWLDGIDTTPDEMLDQLRQGGAPHDMGDMGMGGDQPHDMGAMGEMDMDDMDMPSGMGSTAASPLGPDAGDVDYPMYLINGQPPEAPQIVDVEPGERLRLRLVNVGSDTAFRVAVAGTPLSVTHTDARPVLPVEADAVLLGMGERYDVLITVPGEGLVPVVADAEGKDGQTMLLLRAGPGELPPPDVRPAELAGRLLTYDDLQADPTVSLGDGVPDRTYRVRLTGDMASYEWGVEPNVPDGEAMTVREGERVRLIFDNQTMMFHPMHLHGQPVQIQGANGPGPLKDNVIVGPMEQITVDFIADNPGPWALHCHNIYHAEAGMQTVLQYVR